MSTALANIATLIAADAVTAGDISAARDMLRSAGCEVGAADSVDDAKAVDLRFSGDVEQARAVLADLQDRYDICVQPAANRRKMLLVSDMDSTMITVECIDELADYAGIKPQIAEVTERAMRGELDFAEALRARVLLLKGLDEAMIALCLSERVRPMPGAQQLVQTMTGWGAHTLLVSGGFVQFANDVAARLGFAEARANMLGIADGKLTGKVEGDIVDAEAKRALLAARRSDTGVHPAAIVAVGDGANDILMIAAAIEGGGMGAAYHAKPKAAAASNFVIQHSDLTALLYAQGIKAADWA